MMQKAADLQAMSNLVETKQFGKALRMALRLGHPGQGLTTIKALGSDELQKVVEGLENNHKMKLMEFWNAFFSEKLSY